MSSNKKDNNGWILCPSKSFPGKFYYFNVLNGEAAWCLNDADQQKILRKDNVLQKADKSHSYPEPSSPPAESPTTNIAPIHRTISNTTRRTFPIPPIFGQATFPTYISNVDPYMQNIIWTPIQVPMFAKSRQDQVTQTWEPEREVFVQSCGIPLSKRFVNFEEPKTNLFGHISQYIQNKNNHFSNDSFESQIKKPMTSQIFGQTFQSNQNKNQLMYKTTNLFCNESNKTMTQLFDSNDRYNNNSIKKIVRQGTQSEFDKKIEDILYDNQNYGITSAMPDQAHGSKTAIENFEKPFRRQRTQSDSDSIIFENPKNNDKSKSTLLTNTKVQNNIQQHIATPKTGNQSKTNFVLRKPVLNPNNKIQNSSSEIKKIGQSEKEIIKEPLWFKKDRTFLEEIKKDSDYNKEDILDKLDKDDLRFTLEIKRRKSVDKGISFHTEGTKIKTHKSNTKPTETPKKRVTFDLDSETTLEDHQDHTGNQSQHVNIHSLRRLAEHVSKYWYIVVDSSVLLEDFEFIDKFVQLDGQCRLLIPNSVQSQIESFCFGDCRGQQRVIVARQLIRKLASPPTHIVVQPLDKEDEVFLNMSTLSRVLNCCLQMIEQNDHVVLVTNDSILHEKAISLKIHCYKLKEIKDGATIPEVPASEPIKITVKTDATKNLFLQKDFDATWKIPTAKNIFNKENKLKNSEVQTNIPITTDANTSPINFEETIDKNHGKSNDYLNFDLVSNSDTTDISKTMRKLVIKDSNSNFVLKKSMTKNHSNLRAEQNSFIFQIKNKNTLQKQIPIEQESNQLQNLIQKSNVPQNSKNESIFSIPNEPLKNVKFQIQNKTSTKETKKIEFQTETNKKEIRIIPKSNTSRQLQDKYKSTILEELKNKFQVTSVLMDENIRSNIEEWICTFVQVMENALSVVLQDSNLSTLSLPPPWTLHESVTCVKQIYKECWTVCVVADELSLLLLNNSNKQGQLRRNMKPEDFMRVFGCGVLLLDNLQATDQMPDDVKEAQQLLDNMLLTLQNGKEDIDLIRTPVLTRSDDEDERPRRHNFIKKSSEVLQYLKKHFPAWNHEESPSATTTANDEVITRNNDTKIVRTSGRNLNLLTIDKSNSMTMNAKEFPTTNNQIEKSSNVNENKKVNISPNTLLSSENTEKNIERSEEPKLVRLMDVSTTFSKKNQEHDNKNLKQTGNTENNSQNTTESTIKLYEEPKIVRIFNASTPFPTKKPSKDTNNELILLSPKHGNTFGSPEEMAGPKVVRNIKLIDAFEEKLKFKENMDELDYSAKEETISTVSNSSQSTIVDGNDLNIDKKSLNDQNNDTAEQKNDGSIFSTNNKNQENEIDITDIINNDESNISTNDLSLTVDGNNDIVENNDLKPNDSSTNDSGFVNENDTYTLVQTFLSELSGSMKLIYKFIEDSMKELRNKDLKSEKKKNILEKATTTRGHLTGIIYKLQCIVQREADSMTPLKEVILKADVVVVSDKRMMRYRQVVMKCLEQAQMLDGALRLLLAIANGDYDVTFCSDSSVYFNIFE